MHRPVALFCYLLSVLPVVLTANVSNINKRFSAGKVSNSLADAGLLIHQFDTTDDSFPGTTMYKPCDLQAGTCWFDVPGIGKFDDRVSCSITNAAAPKTRAGMPPAGTPNLPPVGSVGLFNYDRGGVIIDPAAANMTCSYQGDGGTMTRTADERGGGCGCQDAPETGTGKACIEPQINSTAGCNNRCPTPAAPAGTAWLDCHQCAWDGDQLSNMMTAQNAGVGAGGQALIYNEVLIEAAPWRANPAAFVDAFFYPKGSDPASLAGATKTLEAYRAFKQAYPQADAPLLVLDAAWPLHRSGDGPFTVAPGSMK
eukprot:g935.t1